MDGERNWRRLTWGVVLMLVGVAFLAERLGLAPDWSLNYQWWPLLVAILGVARLIHPRSARAVGSGVLMLLMSAWFFIASNDWHGLTWNNSWPLALVAVGLSMVAHAIAARWLPDPRAWKERLHV
jgi:hypothetical protein